MIAFVICIALSGCMLLDDNDDFGKDIVIPASMKLDEPLESQSAWGIQNDTEFKRLCEHQVPIQGPDNEINNVDLPSFDGSKRDLMLRHLATSCKWRLSEKDGRIFAVRRTVDQHGNWTSDLNGFITLERTIGGSRSFRTIIGIDGPKDEAVFHAKETVAKAGLTTVAIHESDNHQPESYFCNRFGRHVLEIYEQTPDRQRLFTSTQLLLLKTELEQLNHSATAQKNGFDPTLMPAFSVAHRKPALTVSKTAYGGVFTTLAHS